jgi:Ser-tRNA(Ala) deacylase AlaX
MNKNIDVRQTKLMYWEDQDLRKVEAEVLDVRRDESGKVALVLDQTIFYPQGGGQPSDVGLIRFSDQELYVEKVTFNHSSEVLHWVSNEQIDDLCGVSVLLIVDSERRDLNTQYHTGAHLLDLMFKLDFGMPFGDFIRGKQFPEDAYMSVDGLFEGDVEDLIRRVNGLLDDLREENMNMIVDYKDVDGHMYRTTAFEGYEEYGVGCGGTHVMNTKDLGRVVVEKIKSKPKKNSTTFWYRMLV